MSDSPNSDDDISVIRAIADGLPAAVVEFDPDLRIVYLNHAAELLAGCGHGEWLGRRAGQCRLLAEARAQWEPALQAVLISGEPGSVSFQVSTGAGPVWILSDLMPVRSGGDQVCGIVGVTRRPSPERAPEGDAARAPASKPATGRATTILLVDDDDLLRASVARVLRREGLAVIEAADGAAAWTRWLESRGEIDLIVCDVELPRWSGPRLIAEIRREAPHLPVVFVSGRPPGEAVLPSGPGTCFLAKPFSSAGLLGAVRLLLVGTDRS